MLLLYHYLKRNNKDTYITYTFLSFFVFFQRISLFVFFLWQDNREGEGNKKWQASYWPTSVQHCSMVRPGHTMPVWPVSGLSMQGWLPHCQLVPSCHIARLVTGWLPNCQSQYESEARLPIIHIFCHFAKFVTGWLPYCQF